MHRALPPLLLLAVLITACDTRAREDAENRPPGYTEPPLEVDYREDYGHRLQVFDPDGDSVTVRAEQLPGWLSFDDEALRFSGVPDWDGRGEHIVRLTASDGDLTTGIFFRLEVTVGPVDCDADFGDPDSSLYVLPYPVGRTYSLIQGYCPPNPAWGHHNSFAYDFDTAIGDTILAARAGVVRVVKEDSEDNTGVGGANTLYIRHADGSQMQYAHFTKNGVLVNVGDYVQQGQPIGLSGNTGASSGPHVHLWLFRDNTVFSREGTLPFNFRNADGPLNLNQGLVYQGSYTARPFVADDR